MIDCVRFYPLLPPVESDLIRSDMILKLQFRYSVLTPLLLTLAAFTTTSLTFAQTPKPRINEPGNTVKKKFNTPKAKAQNFRSRARELSGLADFYAQKDCDEVFKKNPKIHKEFAPYSNLFATGILCIEYKGKSRSYLSASLLLESLSTKKKLTECKSGLPYDLPQISPIETACARAKDEIGYLTQKILKIDLPNEAIAQLGTPPGQFATNVKAEAACDPIDGTASVDFLASFKANIEDITEKSTKQSDAQHAKQCRSVTALAAEIMGDIKPSDVTPGLKGKSVALIADSIEKTGFSGERCPGSLPLFARATSPITVTGNEGAVERATQAPNRVVDPIIDQACAAPETCDEQTRALVQDAFERTTDFTACAVLHEGEQKNTCLNSEREKLAQSIATALKEISERCPLDPDSTRGVMDQIHCEAREYGGQISRRDLLREVAIQSAQLQVTADLDESKFHAEAQLQSQKFADKLCNAPQSCSGIRKEWLKSLHYHKLTREHEDRKLEEYRSFSEVTDYLAVAESFPSMMSKDAQDAAGLAFLRRNALRAIEDATRAPASPSAEVKPPTPPASALVAQPQAVQTGTSSPPIKKSKTQPTVKKKDQKKPNQTRLPTEKQVITTQFDPAKQQAILAASRCNPVAERVVSRCSEEDRNKVFLIAIRDKAKAHPEQVSPEEEAVVLVGLRCAGGFVSFDYCHKPKDKDVVIQGLVQKIKRDRASKK